MFETDSMGLKRFWEEPRKRSGAFGGRDHFPDIKKMVLDDKFTGHQMLYNVLVLIRLCPLSTARPRRDHPETHPGQGDYPGYFL